MTIAEQLKASQDALSALKIEHTKATDSLATITGERDTLKTQVSTLTGERDTARGERDEVTKERDTLKKENGTITTERDELKTEVSKIPETVSRKMADHCSALGIKLPASGVKETKSDLPGGDPKKDQNSELKGRDLLQAGIRAQLVKQGLGSERNLSKPASV